ncbi:MAG: exodeoxyribonuclease VII large subunit [Anaeromassilibacillus sp.]
MVEPVLLTVTQLNTYIKSLLEGDLNLTSVFVSGEISNFTNHYRSGHFYLSLKDEKSVVKSVMFATYARRLRFLPEDGMKVIARGHIGVYEPTGQYQLYIEDLQPDGVGALNLAFEQLKEKLGAEGLFRADRKKPLPPFPTRIGVITSPTGAAVHDIVTILARRWPLAEVIFCPVLVQGEGAAPQLIDALKRMNRLRCADVIILGRGGGSLEDLWPFNEETLARAVAASKIPVISAVGHETDLQSAISWRTCARQPLGRGRVSRAGSSGLAFHHPKSGGADGLVAARKGRTAAPAGGFPGG